MPGAYDLNPSSFSCFPDAMPVPQKVATNAEDDDEIVLYISDDVSTFVICMNSK